MVAKLGWALAVLVAGANVGHALVRARSLGGHTVDTQLALGAGLIALIALMIRFGLGAVTSHLVVDRSRSRGPRERRTPDAGAYGKPRVMRSLIRKKNRFASENPDGT